jgi:hypothetical protein
VRDSNAIVPEDAESELLSTTVLYEAIFVLIPMLPGRKGVPQPGL